MRIGKEGGAHGDRPGASSAPLPDRAGALSRRGFALAALSAVVTRSGTARAGGGLEAVRERAAAATAAGEATGVAVAVARGGKIVWEEGFGWADRERGVAATAHTPFCLASLTKPFTTTALMTFVADGRLALDASIGRFVATAARRGDRAAFESATVEQLGAHLAGFPSTFEMFAPGGPAPPPAIETLLSRYGQLVYPPGQVYEYSNIGYALLGSIASQIDGAPFAEILRRRVLDPLGLRNSFFDTERARLAEGAARYDELRRPIPFYTTSTPPSGELYASAHDVARFAMFNLKHGMGGRAAMLDDRLIDRLHRPVFKGASGAASTFGWFVGRTGSGIPVIFKDGGQPGVSTVLCMLPSEDLACVVLTNRTDNGDLALDLMNGAIGAEVAGWSATDASVTAARAPLAASAGYFGVWQGMLTGDDASARMELHIEPGPNGRLSLGDGVAAPVTDLGLRDDALVGATTGVVPAADVLRESATDLKLKLLRRGDRLVGRILATTERPGRLATLPFAVTLSRA